MRIVIADDVDLVLKGIQALLADWSEAEIVGVYQTVTDLLQGLTQTQPDVVILDDLIDPEIGTHTMLAQVQKAVPRARIILLGRQTDGLIVQELFARGVQAYLYKSDSLAELLIPALRAVWRGKPYLSPTASAEHMIAVQRGRQRWKLDEEALNILRLLAEGQHAGKVACTLGIKIGRVYWVRHKLRRRFSAESNEALAIRAAAEGILP